MVKHTKILNFFEQKHLSKEKLSYPEKLKVFGELYQEALLLKAFSSDHDPLRYLGHTYRLARLLNSRIAS